VRGRLALAATLVVLSLGACAGAERAGLPRVDPRQQTAVGAGGYTTALLGDEKPPSNQAGQPVQPKVTADFKGLPSTNDWWSSLIWPFDRGNEGNPYSEAMFAHPLALKALPTGLGLGGPGEAEVSSRSYFFPYHQDLVVGVEGLKAPAAAVEDYGDWIVTARWEGQGRRLRATFGHGLPFAYFEASGGGAVVRAGASSAKATVSVFAELPGTVGLLVDGRPYGVFAPKGAAWTRAEAAGETVLRSQLGGARYFSVAALPDATPATLAIFRRHAFAFVTGARVSWKYDADSAELRTTFALETVARDQGKQLSPEPLVALYPHQWKNVGRPVGPATYRSPRGPMKLLAAGSFETRLRFGGVLPVLPRPSGAGYDQDTLASFVRGAARADELFPKGMDGTKGTYWTGKSLERVALLAWLAEQVGEGEARATFVGALERVLQDWFDGQTPNLFYYDRTWGTLVGLPSEYRSGWELNDHHFHYGQYIFAAATVARFDPAWAQDARWGGMVDLLIKDCANVDRKDRRFPFLRYFDPYAGHSWANGPSLFPEGNNEESSSEDANFATAVILWGSVTGKTEVRDLGVFLHATLTTAIEQYWFDVDGENFPKGFDRPALGMVWGSGGKFDTWWDRNPVYVHGINFLPFHGGSLYLGRHPDYVLKNHQALVAANKGEPRLWRELIWMYLALADANKAIALSEENKYYEPEFGVSRGFVYHWLHALEGLGQVDTTVTADLPTYAVLRKGETRHHVAFNPGAEKRKVRFSDGITFELGPFEQKVVSGKGPAATASR
jgi:endoglucanase Acf2